MHVEAVMSTTNLTALQALALQGHRKDFLTGLPVMGACNRKITAESGNQVLIEPQ